MTIIPKTIEFNEKEKDTLLSTLKILNEFENKTAYQLEFEDEHLICCNAKDYLKEFLYSICNIEYQWHSHCYSYVKCLPGPR